MSDLEPEDSRGSEGRREPIFNARAFDALPVWALVASFVLIQAWLSMGGMRLQYEVFADWAFYSERMRRGQDLSGMLTYAFLHGGWMHLAMNGVAMIALGDRCWRMMGTPKFLLFFALTSIAGALVFGLIRPEAGPLVGASGAIFGLLAAMKRVEFRVQEIGGLNVRGPVARFLLEILALNLLIGLATGGQLAWEAHLGGFALGWIITPFMVGRR